MDSFYILLSDRINRINWIFSRFPDLTVKIASAFRRKFGNERSKTGNAMVYLIVVNRTSSLTLAINFYVKRIEYTWFHPETGYLKYPTNPVNPVYRKD